MPPKYEGSGHVTMRRKVEETTTKEKYHVKTKRGKTSISKIKINT